MLDFSKAKVLVIGDLMLDRYWSGPVNRISPEGPIPIVNINSEQNKVGGAGNVALNLKALGTDTHLIGMIGEDQHGKDLKKSLKEAKITCDLISTDKAPTITKLRVISQNQQLMRLDFEKSYHDIDKSKLISAFEKQLDKHNIVLFSDYAKGTLSDKDIKKMITLAKKAKKKILIDPKGSEFTKYKGATLVKPNLKEFELIVGKCKDQQDLILKGKKLLKQLKLEYLMITQGSKGMTLIRASNRTSHECAISKEVYDVTGAGDTVIATIAAAIGSKCSFSQAMHFSNIAAGFVIQKLGAATISNEELTKELNKFTPITMGALSRNNLAKQVNIAKDIGKTIVFTNGCFDILHAGHVAYLEKAKLQGDLLIVGVNDDKSIRRLKGKDRPISTIESRLHVLSGLECVDWVVPFHEDTPEALLELLKPDILVKGTDYEIHQIVGHKIVQGYGGEVRRISHKHGKYSTTEYINKIKRLEGDDQ
jgi:D-beta-D-heptose 7-phosphate kinase / D-beta-D-heptose 1-phosphate adenosyltransferase